MILFPKLNDAVRVFLNALFVIIAVIFIFDGVLSAQELPQQQEVVQIVLDGNVRINPSLILGNLKIREGEPYDDRLARDDVNMLFDRFGLIASFSIEKIDVGGVRVILNLREDLRIREFVFRGIDEGDQEKLRKLLGLQEQSFPNRYLLKSNAIKAREHFKSEGYYFAEVNTLLEPMEDGVRLVFEIFKGEKVVIREIRFLGLEKVDDSELRSVMNLDEPTLWIFTDKLKEDLLNKDLQRLNNYLKEEGYLDARVTLSAFDFSDDFEAVAISILVQEGQRYSVRSVEVAGCEAFFPDQIRNLIKIQPGDPYRDVKIAADLRRIQRFYMDRGYIRAEIQRPELTYDEEEPLVDLLFRIVEKGQKFVRDVVISGNSLTKDKVIRREITLNPGDLLKHSERQWSYNQLVATQYFSDQRGVPNVELVPRATDDPQLEDLVVEVEEGGTGMFTFNVGVSTDTGLLGGIRINKSNFDISDSPSSLWDLPMEFFGSHRAFHGGGQTLSLYAMPGTIESSYGVSFFEPYLFDTQPYPVSLSMNFYRYNVDYSDYSVRRYGVSPVLGKRWSRRFSTSLGIRTELIDQYSIDEDAPSSIREFSGKNGLRGLEAGISFKDIDNPRTPSQGYSALLNYDYSGGFAGGDVEMSKAVVGNTIYLPAYETDSGLKHVLSLQGTFGWAEPHSGSDRVPPFERFYLGGASGNFPLRGFRWREVGPRANNEVIGGDAAVGFSAEYSIPLISEYNREYDAEETRLKGVVFYDAGGLGMSLDDRDLWHKIRSSTGVGLKLSMPVLGGLPITVYYGVPLRKWPGDDRRSFNINISQIF
ncbi:MAG: BamA/TamA family outer membrane protein [Planctomycetes bacterium]|nr:BamA/TamA family outer membrane protein [Planctomycetota bacterium]